MFAKCDSDGYRTVQPGIDLKPLVYGEKTMLVRFHLKGGSELPSHAHPHEQTGYLVSGRMTLVIDGVAHDTLPGDSWTIPGNVAHHARILEDCVAIEVFSPIREDFLVPRSA